MIKAPNAIFGMTLIALIVIAWTASGKSSNPTEDSEILVGERNFLTGYSPIVQAGVINVVVEIPAGSIAKWEVSRDGKSIHWELKDGKPRVVDFLPYPGNYGMVPRTLLAEKHGGDGDPLDVLILGPSVPRGSVLKVRPIAILQLLDKGEQDDKIIAVPMSGPMSGVTGFKSLEKKYPGVSIIVNEWFSHYKGDKIESKSYKGSKTAWRTIEKAIQDFEDWANSMNGESGSSVSGLPQDRGIGFPVENK